MKKRDQHVTTGKRQRRGKPSSRRPRRGDSVGPSSPRYSGTSNAPIEPVTIEGERQDAVPKPGQQPGRPQRRQ
jgi:hypothetical protein